MARSHHHSLDDRSWDEESDTLIWGEEQNDDPSLDEAKTVPRNALPPPPPSARRHVHDPSSEFTPWRPELPTPVMLVAPAGEAFRPESRPPALPSNHGPAMVAIPPPARLPSIPPPGRVARRAPPPMSSRTPVRPDLTPDTLRPYAATLPPQARYQTQSARTRRAEKGPGGWLAIRRSLAEFTRGRRVHLGLVSAGLVSVGLVWAAAVLLAWSWALPTPRTVSAVRVVDADAPMSPESPPAEQGHQEPAVSAEKQVETNVYGKNAARAARPRTVGPAARPAPQTVLSPRDVVSRVEGREPTSLSIPELERFAQAKEQIFKERVRARVLSLAKQRDLSSADRAEFLQLSGNPRTYREALLAMATNETWQGPDLIHAALRRYRGQTHVADLARRLLLTDHVYKYASPALTVYIDAETVTECQDVRDLLGRAEADGDYRAIMPLSRFTETTGCGAHGTADCFPCLRSDDALEKTLQLLKRRRPLF